MFQALFFFFFFFFLFAAKTQFRPISKFRSPENHLSDRHVQSYSLEGHIMECLHRRGGGGLKLRSLYYYVVRCILCQHSLSTLHFMSLHIIIFIYPCSKLVNTHYMSPDCDLQEKNKNIFAIDLLILMNKTLTQITSLGAQLCPCAISEVCDESKISQALEDLQAI